MTQSIQFVSGQTLRAAACRSLASPRLLLCPLSTLVTGLDAMQRDYNFSLRGDWRRGTLRAAACRAEAEGETEGLTMASDGMKGHPADVPTTSDTQENSGLAPATPAKETKTAEELADDDPPGLEQGGRLP